MRILLAITAALLLALVYWWPRYEYAPAVQADFTLERVGAGPIIHGGLSATLAELSGDGADYVNINGPSLIRVPAWVENPLGKYYLYFAHHKGSHIRMAYADHIRGPWRIHEPGVLALADSDFPTAREIESMEDRGFENLWSSYSLHIVRDMLTLAYNASVRDQKLRSARGVAAGANALPHVASPEIMVDDENRRLIMYYHGLAGKRSQFTHIAFSNDGLSFAPLPGELHSNYLRVFHHRGQWYGLTMPGILYRSPDGLTDFEPRDRLLFEPDMRHAGLWLREDILYVFWSQVGDAPERLYLSQVDLSAGDWDAWQASAPVEVLRAELPWEGADLKVEPSLRGELGVAANELRDPFVFEEGDEVYLLYVGAGEQAIGLARVHEVPQSAD